MRRQRFGRRRKSSQPARHGEAAAEDTRGVWDLEAAAATAFHLRLCKPLVGLSGHDPLCEENKHSVQISADIC